MTTYVFYNSLIEVTSKCNKEAGRTDWWVIRGLSIVDNTLTLMPYKQALYVIDVTL